VVTKLLDDEICRDIAPINRDLRHATSLQTHTTFLPIFLSGRIVGIEENLAVDIKTWLPGIQTFSESVKIPAGANSGNYDIKVAILDPDTGDPGVMFAVITATNVNSYIFVGQTGIAYQHGISILWNTCQILINRLINLII
jgi:hypothetical protein